MDNDCHPNNILIIDDENDICIALTRLLSMHGYQVSAARNGQEGLTLIRKGNPDFILLDLSLPDMSGWDVAHIIQNTNGRAKVILMTGRAHQLIETEASECSVDFILLKPFDFEDVLDALAFVSVRK